MSQENEKKSDSAPDPELAESMGKGAVSGFSAGLVPSILLPGVGPLVAGAGFMAGALGGAHQGLEDADPKELAKKGYGKEPYEPYHTQVPYEPPSALDRVIPSLMTPVFPPAYFAPDLAASMSLINQDKDEIRGAQKSIEEAWDSISPTLDAMGLGGLRKCVTAAIAAQREFTEGIIVCMEGFELLTTSNDTVENLQEVLGSRFGPVFSDFAQDQVLDHMPSKTAALKGAAMDRYREQSAGQAAAMAKMTDATIKLLEGLGNLVKAHNSYVKGMRTVIGTALIGLIASIGSLFPPATPSAPAVIVGSISLVGSLYMGMMNEYNTARDDILGGIRKIREISIINLRKWPEGAIGYTGS